MFTAVTQRVHCINNQHFVWQVLRNFIAAVLSACPIAVRTADRAVTFV